MDQAPAPLREIVHVRRGAGPQPGSAGPNWTCVQLQRVRATWQRILCALEWACSCQCRQPARIHLATFECATQMCLQPHAWETQRPGIYHGVCVCAREKHVCAGTLVSRIVCERPGAALRAPQATLSVYRTRRTHSCDRPCPICRDGLKVRSRRFANDE